MIHLDGQREFRFSREEHHFYSEILGLFSPLPALGSHDGISHMLLNIFAGANFEQPYFCLSEIVS